jgi:hypothetical protein
MLGAFERHLRRCRNCIAFLNTYRLTIQATRALSYDHVPAEIVPHVRRFLNQRMPLHRSQQ